MTITHSFGVGTAAPRVLGAPGLGWTRVVLSGGFMMVGGAVAASAAPFVLAVLTLGQGGGAGPMSMQSAVQIVGAFVAGVFVLQRILVHVGAAVIGYVVPVLTGTYGAAALIGLAMTGIGASGAVLVSYVVAVAWCCGLFLLGRRHGPPTLAVVPMERAIDLQEIGGVRWTVLDAPDLARRRVDGVVADLHGELEPEWQAFLSRTALSGVPVYHVTQVQEAATGRTQIEHLSENVIGSVVPNCFYAQAKVVIDSLAALAALIVLGPVMLVIALLIKLDSPGPALFTQKRTGYRGQIFTIYKFRTMFEAGSPGRSFTTEDDPRITRIGPFLRRTRLDELPQIFNILRGEMSWIGPRPEAVPLNDWYEREIPFFSYRHIVRPGISGWAQVQQGYAAEIEGVTEKLWYDFYYIKNFSLWLDLVIVAKTISTLVSGNGAR